MEGKVYSVAAEEEGKARLKEVHELLKDITIQMQKYDSIRYWDYGPVGDLGHIAEVLGQVYEFMVEAE